MSTEVARHIKGPGLFQAGPFYWQPIPLTEIVNTTEDAKSHDEGHKSTMAVSLCFWFALLTATAVYGSVVLAPKLAVWSDVRSEYDSNIRQLVVLEEDIEYLERVENALQTDAEFVQRLVGTSGPSQTRSEELIPVSGGLLFGQSNEEVSASDDPANSFLSGTIMEVATNTQLRTLMLTFAACLTIFAFAFLNDAGASFVSATGSLIQSAALVPVTRYMHSGNRPEAQKDNLHETSQSTPVVGETPQT